MSESTTPSKILVVDDNHANAELLEAYLLDTGAVMTLAYSGTEALEKIASDQPDIILLDVMMPDISGFEVCETLKKNPATRDIPIIMVTALTELEDVEKGVLVGTDDFLSKPVNRLELLTRVKSLLRLRHLKNELARTLAYLDELEKAEN